MLDLTTSARKTRYFEKDNAKAARASKFIGRGSLNSSTRAYAKACGARANCGVYSCSDTVMISAEGARRGRFNPDFAEIQLAMGAGALILTDIPADRERAYNVGERQVANYLARNGYVERRPGCWHPN